MMKRFRLLAAVLAVFLFLLSGCGRVPQEPDADYRVVIASDLHYLAPDLTDHGELFRRVMAAGDGKVTEYCDEITEAFLSEVIAFHPEALILTGDISFNGARASHETLAEKLAKTEAAGIPVLVLPGNHDMYRMAYSYIGDTAEQVETVSEEAFREIYAAFGFDEAISSDDDSLSYVAQINDKTRVMMLDANTPHDFCGLSEKTLSWVDEQLSEAAEAEQAVLVACHQNLFQHSMFNTGYVLNNSEKLQAILNKHGVPLFLSGHMHIQHIQTEGELTEIATSALTMGACQYAVLESSGGRLCYQTRPVAVSEWAAEQGIEDENLARFADYALESMEKRTRAQAEAQLRQLGVSEEEIPAMADYASTLNLAYFNGNLSGIPLLDPDGALQKSWEESGSFFGFYFRSLRSDIGQDYTRWEREG